MDAFSVVIAALDVASSCWWSALSRMSSLFIFVVFVGATVVIVVAAVVVVVAVTVTIFHPC